MAVLVAGGAGYIGSHTVAELIDQGEEVVILDNLYQGHQDAVVGGTFYRGDMRDEALLAEIFTAHNIEAVVHFAAHSLVGESVEKPLDYYENNVVATHTLVRSMIRHNVKKIVFSSTAATYGVPEQTPITETDPQIPTNPYGETKLAIERMLAWCGQAYGLQSVCLRYFNVAGAHPKGHIGEDHTPESHLIPIILQVALGQRERIHIFGEDYDTRDGTCIRDYIHVMDLANAHWLALNHLREGGPSTAYNLGHGQGFTVKEVIEHARKVTGHPIPAEVAPRRAGDPPVLIASSDKIKRELGWQPKYNSLEAMLETAWKWHQAHPNGYRREVQS
ncbi:UDP-glucose 4-epimerase GalE [Caldalkalibacillus salinus]|uniref:UDP-glucose 4-epimerase GalE n=1 Tax=Caldalkalibacillus salinus TaxID=2803787 RepID=UPI0019208B5A|nr:UDP-glucose 4-epimerase GalE [Caldalkalibacillus salinus]